MVIWHDMVLIIGQVEVANQSSAENQVVGQSQRGSNHAVYALRKLLCSVPARPAR